MTYTLYLGDCLEYMRTMPDKSVDAVITDPPYPEDNRFESSHKFIHEVAISTYKIAKDNSWLTSDFLRLKMPNYVQSWMPWEYYDMITAFVINSMATCAFGVDRFIPSLVFKKGKPRVEARWSNVVQVVRTGKKDWSGHPSEKYLPVYRKFIAILSKSGDTIFDPFMGSGTTGVACMQLGRNFIGCEIDPKYYAIAEKRIKQAAQQEPLFV